jgi:hypothetical protein
MHKTIVCFIMMTATALLLTACGKVMQFGIAQTPEDVVKTYYKNIEQGNLVTALDAYSSSLRSSMDSGGTRAMALSMLQAAMNEIKANGGIKEVTVMSPVPGICPGKRWGKNKQTGWPDWVPDPTKTVPCEKGSKFSLDKCQGESCRVFVDVLYNNGKHPANGIFSDEGPQVMNLLKENGRWGLTL